MISGGNGGSGSGGVSGSNGGSGGGGIVIVQSDLVRLKRNLLRALRHMEAGGADVVASIRQAVDALPDRRLLSRLPGEIRVYIETQLALLPRVTPATPATGSPNGLAIGLASQPSEGTWEITARRTTLWANLHVNVLTVHVTPDEPTTLELNGFQVSWKRVDLKGQGRFSVTSNGAAIITMDHTCQWQDQGS